MKNKGNLLIEFLLSMFIFSIIMLMLIVFLKRILIIQKYEFKTFSISENQMNITDLLRKRIKERDKNLFFYNEKKANLFLIKDNKIIDNGNEILLKYENKFHSLKFKDNKLLISSAENLGEFKRWEVLARLENLNFLLKKDLLILSYLKKKKKIDEVINIK
ncbi:MAG: hypothetical protein KBF12_05160 [Sebaldella sp.]|nr:hypothetical protein [Sebaldella sp.]